MPERSISDCMWTYIASDQQYYVLFSLLKYYIFNFYRTLLGSLGQKTNEAATDVTMHNVK